LHWVVHFRIFSFFLFFFFFFLENNQVRIPRERRRENQNLEEEVVHPPRNLTGLLQG